MDGCLDVKVEDGTTYQWLKPEGVSTATRTVWMNSMGQHSFKQQKPRAAFLRLLPAPRGSEVTAEPVMLGFEGAAKAGHDGLLGTVVKYTAGGKHSDVYSIEIVSALIDFKWHKYGRARFLYEIAAHATLLLAWTYFTMHDASATAPTFSSLNTVEAAVAAALCVVAAVGVEATNNWWQEGSRQPMQVPPDRPEDDQHARAVALALAREYEKLETEHEARESPPRSSEDTGVDNANHCHKRRLYRRRWVSALAAVLVCAAGTLMCVRGDVDLVAAGAMTAVLFLSARSLIQEAKQLASEVPTTEDFDRDFPRTPTSNEPTAFSSTAQSAGATSAAGDKGAKKAREAEQEEHEHEEEKKQHEREEEEEDRVASPTPCWWHSYGGTQVCRRCGRVYEKVNSHLEAAELPPRPSEGVRRVQVRMSSIVSGGLVAVQP
jgi:hypothetical protein